MSLRCSSDISGDRMHSCHQYYHLSHCLSMYYGLSHYVSMTQQCTHEESVTKCRTVTFHWSSKFTLFTIASNSIKFMQCALFTGLNQHASSTVEPSTSRRTAVASKLALTNILNSCLFTHHKPSAESLVHILMMISSIICLWMVSCTLSSHPDIIWHAYHFKNAFAGQNQSYTSKCPLNFPNNEKMPQWMIISSIDRILLMYRHLSLLCSPHPRYANPTHGCHHLASHKKMPCLIRMQVIMALFFFFILEKGHRVIFHYPCHGFGIQSFPFLWVIGHTNLGWLSI